MQKAKIIAIIQARIGSTRLPGKVLIDLVGDPILVHDVNRLSRARRLDEIVIATSIHPDDDVIDNLCAKHGWQCFRGSEEDLLDRYYKTAMSYNADIVVRITADCPLIDPEIVDLVIQEFLNRQPDIDYVSNTIPVRTFPRGLDTEVIRFDVLERVWQEDNNPAWREHVTPYIHNNLELFQTFNVVNEKDYSQMRWTIDTPEDLEFVRRIYNHFGHNRFSWLSVLDLLDMYPDWLDINRDVIQKKIQ